MSANEAVSSAQTSSPAPVSVAVVGAGYWGVNHVRTFARLAGCELARVCDPDAKNLKRAAGLAPSAKLGGDYAEVLADPRIDAVVLATPAVLHAEQTIAALRAGKHVLCEKPLTTTLEEAASLLAHAREAKRVLFPAHNYKHAPVVKAIREIIESGKIGKVRSVTLNTFRNTHAKGVTEW